MSIGRLPLPGLLAVLLALMVQLGIGGAVPRIDPFAAIGSGNTICHTTDDGSDSPSRVPGRPLPGHPPDCLVCPLCVAVQGADVGLLPQATPLVPSAAAVLVRVELPPPSTAPPSRSRPPSQPRAPPTVS